MVRMATANGLEAHARVLLLTGCPSVLSLGRLVEEHKCIFMWDDDGAVLIGHAGNCHECVVRNYVPFLGQGYAFPAPEVSTEELLDEIMPGGHGEQDEDRPGVIRDLTHLRGMTAKLVGRRSRCLLRGERTRTCGSAPVVGRTRSWLTTSARAI